VSNASYELFKTIMASNNWKAARLAVHGAFKRNVESSPPAAGEPKEILKFLGHHLDLQGAGEDHTSSIEYALEPFLVKLSSGHWPDPLVVECIGKFDCASPSFVSGIRSIIRPSNSSDLRWKAAGLMALISSQWFDSPTPVMEPEEMSEFCEHLAVQKTDDALHGDFVQRCSVTILFGMLRSSEWRKHIPTRFWCVLAHCALVEEELESFKWCLQNATDLLEYTRGLADGEGLKWWYGVLWLHLDRLDTTVLKEVEGIAKSMSLGDGLSDLELYRDIIVQEIRRGVQAGVRVRTRFAALEENRHRLAQIIDGRHRGGR